MNTERLKSSLRIAEAVRSNVYDDYNGNDIKSGSVVHGNPTIGVGRNLSAKPLTPTEIEFLLDNDMRDAVEDAKAVIGAEWTLMDDARQEVFAEMAFHLGRRGLAGFVETIKLAKKAARGEATWAVVAKEATDSDWARRFASRATRLTGVLRYGEVSS